MEIIHFNRLCKLLSVVHMSRVDLKRRRSATVYALHPINIVEYLGTLPTLAWLLVGLFVMPPHISATLFYDL